MNSHIDRPRALTLIDVAKRCGFGRSTVSRALRGDANVHPATREKIIAVAREMGYTLAEQEMARRMVLRKIGKEPINHVVSLFFPPNFFDNPYRRALFRGISEVFTSEQYALLLTPCADPSLLDSGLLPPIFERREVDGAILTPYGTTDVSHLFHALRITRGFAERPAVTIIWEIPQCSAVVADDAQGAYLGTQHLLQLGHRHLLHNFDANSSQHHAKRFAGMQQAYHELGMAPDRHLHYLTLAEGWDQPSPYTDNPFLVMPTKGSLADHPLLATLKAHPEITAILAYNDCTAIHNWNLLRKAGLRVPEDISIVGFDDVFPLYDASGNNLLTTVRVPLVEIGRAAALLLIRQIAASESDIMHIVLPTNLVNRKTTASPPLLR